MSRWSADLAAHCTPALAYQSTAVATSATSAADLALGYTNGFSCTDEGFKAALAGIDVVIDESSGDNTYTMAKFGTNFNLTSADDA